MSSVRIKIAVAALAAAVALSAGCRTGVRAVPSSAPVPATGTGEAAPGSPAAAAPAEAPLAHLGYSVQVGAFAVYDNARALAGALTAAGLDAFYFHSGSGIFKVRFGNFPSRDSALAEAGKLK
jgi:cell division septation protein DedD